MPKPYTVADLIEDLRKLPQDAIPISEDRTDSLYVVDAPLTFGRKIVVDPDTQHIRQVAPDDPAGLVAVYL